MSEQQFVGIWCLVANVAPEQVYGEEHDIRLGTKHFSPKTKVYCFPPAWGDGYEQIRVIGRHRGSSRLVTLIMPSRRLTNWRVNYVRHPYVVRHMEPGWTKEQAEKMLASLLFNREAEQARQQGFYTVAPDQHILYAARFGLNDEIQAACARGASPNAQWQRRWTPLLLATAYGHAQTVKLLVELGATVDFTNEYQETALACAKSLHHNEVIRFLEQATPPA
jgi:ankyrin repeat protein